MACCLQQRGAILSMAYLPLNAALIVDPAAAGLVAVHGVRPIGPLAAASAALALAVLAWSARAHPERR